MKLRFVILLLAILCLTLSSTVLAQQILFDDGPTNGTITAFYIDGPNPGPYSQWISDGFTATGSGIASYFVAGLWVPTGETPTTLTWWLGTSAFSGNIATGTDSSLQYTFLMTNSYGYDVYNVTVTGLSGMLTAGDTYYLTLGNGNDSGGDQFVAWDMNNGAAACYYGYDGGNDGGCGYPGEAFTLYASSSVPEPSSLLLLGSGVLGLAGLIRRRIGL
ncbi:MAG TPA: PEP-CTERM sorting domain-containing protein [Terriglobales bacterium]|nr:PEP-CTERM sorting domain-containing protein [Terriglobales bacterium]